MKISGSGASCCSRRCSTWRAMMSRKDSPRRTHSSDLARSMPIEVPRPPLSLITAVVGIAARGRLVVDLDVGQRLHVDRLDARLGDHPGLAVLEQAVVVRERLDRDLVDAGVRHLLAGTLSLGTHAPDRRLAACAVSMASDVAARQDGVARPAADHPRRRPLLERSDAPPGRWPSTCSAGSRGTPRGHRRGVRLGRRRARHRPAPRRAARGRQAGDPAGAAARRRPRLGGVRRRPDLRPAHAAGCSSRRAPPRPGRGRRRRRGAGARAGGRPRRACGWAAAAAPTTGRSARVPVGTFTCVLLYDDEVGLDVPREPHDRPVTAVVSPPVCSTFIPAGDLAQEGEPDPTDARVVVGWSPRDDTEGAGAATRSPP